MKRWLPAWLIKHLPADAARVLHHSQYANIYHCTVQKSASQWFRQILSDPRTYQYCGLSLHPLEREFALGYDPRKITERRFEKPFPPGTILTPIYIDYAGFAAIPKPARYKAFFVMRDPRDVLVSWYFSVKCSHALNGKVERIREKLANLPETDGLLHAMNYLHDFGLFAAQRSWLGAAEKDANVLSVRFEDLTGPRQVPVVERVLAHCDIPMPRPIVEDLLNTLSFETLSGRQRGQEDRHTHYRKGVAGDWRNHFDARIQARFDEVAGDLVAAWNYERM